MKTFILILWITGYYNGGATSSEFDTQAACENAGRASVEKFGGFATNVYFVCVPKASSSVEAPVSK